MKTLFTTAIRVRPLLMLALMLAASLAVSGDRFLAFVVGITMIHILWTAGMNLLTGYTGLVPLVYAGIAGVSAYATVALTMQHRWSFWLATPASALLAALVGVLLGLPSLRLKGFYFARVARDPDGRKPDVVYFVDLPTATLESIKYPRRTCPSPIIRSAVSLSI